MNPWLLILLISMNNFISNETLHCQLGASDVDVFATAEVVLKINYSEALLECAYRVQKLLTII